MAVDKFFCYLWWRDCWCLRPVYSFHSFSLAELIFTAMAWLKEHGAPWKKIEPVWSHIGCLNKRLSLFLFVEKRDKQERPAHLHHLLVDKKFNLILEAWKFISNFFSLRLFPTALTGKRRKEKEKKKGTCKIPFEIQFLLLFAASPHHLYLRN